MVQCCADTGGASDRILCVAICLDGESEGVYYAVQVQAEECYTPRPRRLLNSRIIWSISRWTQLQFLTKPMPSLMLLHSRHVDPLSVTSSTSLLSSSKKTISTFHYCFCDKSEHMGVGDSTTEWVEMEKSEIIMAIFGMLLKTLRTDINLMDLLNFLNDKPCMKSNSCYKNRGGGKVFYKKKIWRWSSNMDSQKKN